VGHLSGLTQDRTATRSPATSHASAARRSNRTGRLGGTSRRSSSRGMRRVMRRTALVLIAVLLFSACRRGGLTIYAPAECAQGAIFIDGKQAGHFEKTQRLYRWLGWSKMKKEL